MFEQVLFFFLAIGLTGQNMMDLAKPANISFEAKAPVPLEPNRRYSEYRVFCYVYGVSLGYVDWGRRKRRGRGTAGSLIQPVFSPPATLLPLLLPLLYLNWGKPEDNASTWVMYVC